MKKTIIYLRKSLDSDKQPQSLTMQRDIAMEYARKNDWMIHEVYNEGMCSARKTEIAERPELNRLLSDIKENKIARIIVFKRDRLARNVQQYIEIYRLIKNHQVELHFTAENEPPPFQGATSEFIEAIMAGISEHEANNIVRRLILSKIPLIRKGYWQVGRVPFAYESINKKNKDSEVESQEDIYVEQGKESNGNLVIIPEKAALAEALYKEVDKLPSSFLDEGDFYQVCKIIRQNDLFKELKNEQIWRIIVQPLHKGILFQKLDGEEYSIDNEITQNLRIVSDELWEKANHLFRQLDVPPHITKETNPEEDSPFESDPLLDGLLYCGKCEQPLAAKKKVYKCQTENCKNSPKVKQVEHEVLEKLISHLLQLGSKDWKKLIHNLNRKYAAPFKRLAETKAKELAVLEERIKNEFQDFVQYEEHDSEKRLSSWIEQYKTTSKQNEVLESLYYHIHNFIIDLDKEKTLEKVSIDKLTRIEKQHLLSLVKRVSFYKKPSNLYCYEIMEVTNE